MYRSDDRDLEGHDLDLFVRPPSPGGNGDWYVGVCEHGARGGCAVRVVTSGSPRGQHGVCVAIAHLYAAIGGEPFSGYEVCPISDPAADTVPLTEAGRMEVERLVALPRRTAEVRTPEVVLRAMLKAYEAAALDLAVSLARETGSTSHRSLWEAEDQVDRVRVTLAHCIANGGQFPGADEPIEQDYLDRLSGVRPLDAPPPGNRFPGGGPESTRGAGP